MKVLAATKETQGRRKNDFCHCSEGELVTYGSECDGEALDGVCGCKRSLIGFDSSKATTTFRVTTVDLTVDRLKELLRAKLAREGWASPDTPRENEDLLRIAFNATIELWSGLSELPDGVVLERRGPRFRIRTGIRN